jgi:hypothetical protein
MRFSAAIRAIGRDIGARSNVLNRALGRCCRLCRAWHPRCSATPIGSAGVRGGARRLDGAVQIDALLADGLARAGYDYLWFYRQFWRADLQPLVQLRWLDLNTGLAEGPAHQGGSNQHGAFARGAAAVARSSAGGVHAERRSRSCWSTGAGAAASCWCAADGAAPAARDTSTARSPGSACRCIAGSSATRRAARAVRAARERGVLAAAVSSEFRRAWYLLVLDRWFTAFG